MSNFKPQVTYTTKDSLREYHNNQRKSMYIVEQFKTYRELKKALTEILEKSNDVYVSVVRSRRSEWGEWFECWGYNSERKPIITKKGWM
jgi:hypothetical protein